jgi:putative ABC transport system ATP-binding protein
MGDRLSNNLIEVQRVTKVYRTGDIVVRALRGVTLPIECGEFVALMGPSGSGKSTFLNVICCLDQPTSGRYLLDGVDVSRLGRNQLARIRNRKIGFVFQNFNLLPRTTAIDNVELPLLYQRGLTTNRRRAAYAALEMVGLSEYADHHPNQLSGGQQQRVAIAHALVNHPEVILADEPTGSLDSRSSIEIMAVFQQLNLESGITLMMVTHEPDIAAHASRIIRFQDGRIIDDRRIASPRDAARELTSMPLVEDASEEEMVAP